MLSMGLHFALESTAPVAECLLPQTPATTSRIAIVSKRAETGPSLATLRRAAIRRGCAKTLRGSEAPSNFEAYRLAAREKP